MTRIVLLERSSGSSCGHSRLDAREVQVLEVRRPIQIRRREPDVVDETVGPEGWRLGWALGVQWHPERTAATDPTQQALFGALVDRARARMHART